MAKPLTLTHGLVMRYPIVSALAVALLVVGCQSSEPTIDGLDGGDSTTRSAPAPSATASTAPVTTPSSRVDPRAEAQAQIRAVMQLDWEMWMACSASPVECRGPDQFAPTSTTTGRFYTSAVEVITQWAAEGLRYRQPEGREDNNFVITESVTMADDLTTATAVTCTRDGRAGYLPGPTGDYVLVEGTDAEVIVRSERYLMLVDGVWKIDDFKILEQSELPEGTVLCAP